VVICKLRKCSTGLLARATHGLSKTLLNTETRHEEALRQQAEARRLRKRALEDYFDEVDHNDDDSFEAYDSLIAIMER
jgi:hypothetical protein